MAQRRRPGGRSKSSGSRDSGTEEAKAHQPSFVDAMGQDKRRQVVGHSYGPSRRSQVVFFVAVAVLLLVVIGGGMAAVATFDQTPDEFPDRAPWAETASTPDLVVQQRATPKPVDTVRRARKRVSGSQREPLRVGVHRVEAVRLLSRPIARRLPRRPAPPNPSLPAPSR